MKNESVCAAGTGGLFLWGGLCYTYLIDEKQEELGKLLQELCWNEDRFIRGFTEAGEVIGKRTDPEANMWLNPQSWAVISGLAKADQADMADKAV